MPEILVLMFLFPLVISQSTKILRFQIDSGGIYTTEEWAEFKGKIPHLGSFTACHWERLRFFSVRDSCQWAFCYKNKDLFDDHHCTQIWYNRDIASGGRYVVMAGGFGDNSYGGNNSLFNIARNSHFSEVMMKTFKHRSWNQICWTFQSKTGTNKFYLNGVFQGSYVIDSEFIRRGVLGSDEVFTSSFIIGQEPDPPSPRGGFEAEQVFVGDITEFNLWNFTLDDITINLMGKCKKFGKGNIIPWDLKRFIVNKVKIEDIDLADLCKPVNQLLVFPKKRSWSAAQTLCTSHGGSLQAPANKEENNKLTIAMEPYKDTCADPVSGNIVWLGIKSEKYILSVFYHK